MKTYQSINPRNEKSTFSISKMEAIYQKREGAIDVPHRHNFYTVMLVKRAMGIHKIDFNEYPLHDYQVFFVAPGQVHQVVEEEASVGYAMTFTAEFLMENGIQLAFIEQLNLFHDYGQSPPLVVTDELFSKLETYAKESFDLFHSHAKLKNFSIGAYIKLFLIECNEICSVDLNEEVVQHSDNYLVKRFKSLVDGYFREEHSTSFYAAQLFISADHLNRTIKSTIGKTAKAYIQSRIITEAKRLLFFSTSTSKEVSFELGFHEPANFSAFFKKEVGVSPSKFARVHR